MKSRKKAMQRGLAILLAAALTLSTGVPAFAAEPTTADVKAHVTAPMVLGADETALTSETLSVVVDTTFPRVLRYELNGKTIYGQESRLTQLKINGTLYTPSGVTHEATADSITYTMVFSSINVTIKVRFQVTGAILSMNVTEIDDAGAVAANKVKKLEFANQKLISVKEAQPGSAMAYNANYLGGDVISTVAAKSVEAAQKNGHVILNTAELAASIEVGVSCQNVYVETAGTSGSKITSAWPYEYLYRGPDGETMELPWAKVIITEDRNNDGVIDWQDGAVAYRDIQDSMPGDQSGERPGTGSLAKESIFVNIPLNYRGRLPWTYENMLDMLKRQAMATDNFPQVVLIKNIEDVNMIPGFGNANQRLGGVPKFNEFVTAAKDYNIHIGGHVDTNLSYPNSPLNGGTPLNTSYGAAWDQLNREGKSIDTTKYWSSGLQGEGDDTATYGRYGLLGQRYDLQSNTYPGLDFLYVDVELGKSSGELGADAKWHAYNVVQKFKEHGWNLYTEYPTGSLGNTSDVAYRDSIATKYVSWVHVWPGSGSSVIRRFIMNHETVLGTGTADYQHVLGRIPPSGDNADAMTHGYMGWVDNGRPTTLAQCLDEFWSIYLPVTYLKNFEVLKVGTDPANGNKMSAWFTNGVHTYYDAPFMYIKKDGKLIAKVDSNSTPANVVKAANEVFIPWDAQTEDKIYTKLVNGGSKTWDLPNSWSGLSSVALYRLDQSEGRIFEETLPVSNGKVSIDYAANQGYVLAKGQLAPIDPKWGEGSLIHDFEFNSGSFNSWNPDGYAYTYIAEDAATLNRSLRIEGSEAGGVTQTITGLEPGKGYVITALAKSEGGKQAVLSVTANGLTKTSDISYPVNVETDRKNQAWPMLRVYFTAPADGTATLKLRGEASSGGAVNFDDLRLNIEEDPYGKGGNYYLDDVNDSHWLGSFMHNGWSTNVAVSYYNDLDVHGNSRGADKSYSIDTIEKKTGERSIRVMGSNGGNNGSQSGIIIRTLPSLLKFAPTTAKSYKLSFDYKPLYSTGANWGVTLLTSENGTEFKNEPLTAAQNAVATYTVSFNTGAAADVAFAIKHLGTNKNENLVIDNVKVEEITYDASLPAPTPAVVPPEVPEGAEGTNLALNKPATASAEEGGGIHATRHPSCANDGHRDTSTGLWASGTNRDLNQWWKVDLGAVYDLSQTIIVFEKDNSAGWLYDLYISNDDTTWTNFYGFTDAASTAPAIRPVNHTPGTAIGRYVRVNFTGLSPAFPGMSAHLVEFEAYGVRYYGPNVAVGKAVTVAGETGSTAALTDGNTTTKWTAATAGDKELVLDLQSSFGLTGATLVYDSAAAHQFKVETWDGSNWVSAADQSTNADSATRHHVSFTATTSKLRVTLLPGAGNTASLNELLVQGTELLQKDALKTAIDHARTIDLSPYTQATADALRAALQNALQALNSGTTQSELNSATAALKAAEGALVRQPLGTLAVTLAPADGKVTLAGMTSASGEEFYYKHTAASDTANKPLYGSTDVTGWTAFTASTDIVGTNGTVMFVQVIKKTAVGIVAWGENSSTPTAQTFTLTVTGGKITSDGDNTSGSYAPGTSITVTADETPAGQRFTGWTATGISLTTPSAKAQAFSMPSGNVTLIAQFENLPELGVLTPTLTYGDSKVILAKMTGAAGEEFYYKHTAATDAVNKPVYGSTDVTGWTAFTANTNIPGTNGTAIFVQVIKKTTANGIVAWGEGSATPEPTKYTLTVEHGRITSDGNKTSGSYPAGTTVTVTVNEAPSGQRFKKWVATGMTPASDTTQALTFQMPAGNVTLSALFENLPTLEVLTPVLTPGDQQVTLSAMTGEAFYYKHTSASDMENKPTYGETDLTGWTVFTANVDITGLTNGTQIFVQVIKVVDGEIVGWGERSATPVAPAPDTYLATVKQGSLAGGDSSGYFTEGAEVAIIADAPEAGWVFSGWTAEGEHVSFADASATETTFSMPAEAVTVTATYEQTPFTVTVEHGTGSGDYTAGETVSITAAAPETEMCFARWTTTSTDVEFASTTAAETSFTMPNHAVTVTAIYEKIPGVGLNSTACVLYVGGGTGTKQLTVHVAPEDAVVESTDWVSDNESVVTVQNGLLTAVRAGGAVITVTVTTQYGTYHDRCVVTVTQYEAPPTPPSGGGGGSSAGGSTHKNPDGSTTTTVTNKTTGAVTSTTKRPDGTIETLVTEKNGTVTKTIVAPDGKSSSTTIDMTGTIVETVSEPNGKVVSVTTERGGKVTKTISEPDGKQILTVTETTGDKLMTVTNKDGEKLAELTLPASVPVPEKPFLDMDGYGWAKNAMDITVGMGLFSGTSKDSFSGGLKMSRGMLVTALHRLSGSVPGKGENMFEDVAGNAWYADAVVWASSTGVATGSGSSFAPNDAISRESLALMLYRYASLLGCNIETDSAVLEQFSDGTELSSWSKNAMCWAVESSILNGKTGGVLDAYGTATRAEAAVMLQRFVEYLNK